MMIPVLEFLVSDNFFSQNFTFIIIFFHIPILIACIVIISAPVKGEMKAVAERSSTDMKRERRLKKKKQHLKRVDREERTRLKGLGLRNVKLADNIISRKKGKKGEEGVLPSTTKELKSSKAFFDKLQDKVQTQIKEKLTKSKKSEPKKSPQAKRFKL